MHGELFDLIVSLDSDEGRLGALSDDGNALTLGVLLGQVSQSLGDLLQVLGLEPVRLGVRGGLGLISDNVVPVRGAGVKGLLEELRDERCGKRQDEGLVLGSSLLGELLDRRRADCSALLVAGLSWARHLIRYTVDIPVKW